MSIKLYLRIVNGSGADFSKQIPAKFEARVKGKGKIDVYVNNLKGTVLVSLIYVMGRNGLRSQRK